MTTQTIETTQLPTLPAEHTCLLCSNLRLSRPNRSGESIKQYYPTRAYTDSEGKKHQSLRSAYYPGVFTSPFCWWHQRQQAASKGVINGAKA